MFLLFEEAGKFLAGRILSEADSSAQVELDSGKRIKVKVHTLCVHGDEATGVVVARGIRKALEEADIQVVTLPQMKL